MKTAPKNNQSEDKPQPSLLPIDLLTELLEPAYREGVLKYKRESWRDGFNISIMMDACMRHLTRFYYEGEDLDQETLEKFGIEKQHLGAAIFCLISMYNTIKTRSDLDDRFAIRGREDIQETKKEIINTGSGGTRRVCDPSYKNDVGGISRVKSTIYRQEKT